MEIKKIYTIITGHFYKENGDKQIDWYDDIKLKISESGYRYFQFHPFEYPIFTTFEEADKACRSDWHDMMFEGWDNYAKICEYTNEAGLWNLTHEWFYTTEKEYDVLQQIENEKGKYKLFKENSLTEEGIKINEILYKRIK